MIRFNEPLNSNDWRCQKMTYCRRQPVRSRSTIVVRKRDDLAPRKKCSRIPCTHRAPNMRMPIIYWKSKCLSAPGPNFTTLIYVYDFEVSESLGLEPFN